MIRIGALLGISLGLLFSVGQLPQSTQKKQAKSSESNTPQYTADGRLKFPENYREWVYLSTGIDMSYGPASDMGHSMFDNVFVNPESYKAFLVTGTWPDKTMLVLEVRGAANKNAINKAGHYQTPEIMGLEVHVKDETRFKESGKWAFFGFDSGEPSKMIPKEMDCYSCHREHAAVDTTFVQFYPTLIEIARKKGTLSPAYVKDEAAAAATK
jgi:Cytochrome P460